MSLEELCFTTISISSTVFYSDTAHLTTFFLCRVVATQLSAKLTKHLVLTDPYRIKSPAEIVPVDFQLPLGVQLLFVYLDVSQFHVLRDDASRCKRIREEVAKKEEKKVPTVHCSKELTLSAMKRDQSLIFTAVPEEDPEHHSPINIETAFVSTRSKIRPKFLNLRSKTTDEPSNIKMETSSVPTTPYCAPISVCSTPLADIKKVVHQEAMSICTNPNKNESECNPDSEVNISFKTESVNSILSAVEEKSHTSLHSIDCTEKLLNATPYVNVGMSLYDKKKFSSMFELREKLKCLTKRVTMKYYNKDPTNLNKALTDESPKKEQKKKTFGTITDPTFPVFRNDGKVISRSFYEAYIQTHLTLVNSEINRSKDALSDNNTIEWKSVEDFDTSFNDVFKNQTVTTEIEMQPLKYQHQSEGSSKSTSKTRKPLSLPLKSLTTDDCLITPSYKKERYLGGVQLTPLMTKLSMLAMEDRSSEFCTTPSEYKDLYTPSQPNFSFLKKRNVDTTQESSVHTENENKFQKCILFICGQQDMVVNVLLEETASSSPDVINKMVGM